MVMVVIVKSFNLIWRVAMTTIPLHYTLRVRWPRETRNTIYLWMVCWLYVARSHHFWWTFILSFALHNFLVSLTSFSYKFSLNAGNRIFHWTLETCIRKHVIKLPDWKAQLVKRQESINDEQFKQCLPTSQTISIKLGSDCWDGFRSQFVGFLLKLRWL